jgi:predicted DNA-binding transcriptional regulator AlpA
MAENGFDAAILRSKDNSAITVPGMAPPMLMDAEAIARELSIGIRTLFRWISSGVFPPADVRIGGKIVRWKRDTLVAWLACERKTANCFRHSEDSQ